MDAFSSSLEEDFIKNWVILPKMVLAIKGIYWILVKKPCVATTGFCHGNK
jgi:hypothetical protein